MRISFLHKSILYLICFGKATLLLAQDGIVKGRVHSSNEDLPNATVSVGGKTSHTDKDGSFSFGLGASTYSLVVSHIGYTQQEHTIVIKEGKTTTVDISLVPSQMQEEMVTVGSRSFAPRSNLETPVPVDALSPKQLLRTGQVTLSQMLNFTAPSFNASRELLNEPVTLRGLDPQHVLILINGTRYHNLAWYNGGGLKGQIGRGSAGNDVNALPFSSIEKVEILRDGASAQYGSDAIAGVINIRLKETTGRTSVHLHMGQYYEGDGEKLSLRFNRGFQLNKKGFVNISGEYGLQLPAYRGNEYQGTVYTKYPSNATRADSLRVNAIDDSTVRAKNFDRKSVLDNAGTLKSIRAGALVNGGYKLNTRYRLFWTAATSGRTTWRDAVYRFPKNPQQVNFDLYPNGYQANNKLNTTDVSTIAGIEGRIKEKARWNFTSSYGSNRVLTNTYNNCNPSQSFLGINAPTSFYVGKQLYQLLTNNVNWSRQSTTTSGETIQVSAGGEWRFERYSTGAGEEASWMNYDSSGAKQAGAGGISPANVVDKSRNVLPLYLDGEKEFKHRFLLGAASRYEYYSDYGGNLALKLSTRYALSKKVSIRATVNNGFRAPSLQQRYASSIASGVTRFTGIPFTSGLFPNDEEVVRALGVPSLTAERSVNVSGGVTAKINKRNSLTIDGYTIHVKDRVLLSGVYDRSNRAVDSILKMYPDLSQVTSVQFFSNAMNTTTYGVDLVVNGFYNFSNSVLRYSLAANFNTTRVSTDLRTPANIPSEFTNANTLLSRVDKGSVEDGQPHSKIILNLTYDYKKFQLVLNNTRFGRTTVLNDSSLLLDETYGSKILTDISLNLKTNSWMTITIGANNVFNVYPDPIIHPQNTAQGIFIYSPDASPFGFYGGYYFLSLKLDW
jgi:iron complex outermembrane recepter protein